MAKRKKTKQEEEVLIDIFEAREQAQDFFQRNQIIIIGLLVVLIVGVGGWFAYDLGIRQPRENDAQREMSRAEYQFRRDSFALALANPGGGFLGFLDVINDRKYRNTDAANAAKYYAGVCYLHLGQYQAAVDFLKDYEPAGKVLPSMANGLIGDAYSELQDFDNALTYYKRASSTTQNDISTPYYLMKVGLLLERQNRAKDALTYYQQIKEEYPTSVQGEDIDRYIARVEAATN